MTITELCYKKIAQNFIINYEFGFFNKKYYCLLPGKTDTLFDFKYFLHLLKNETIWVLEPTATINPQAFSLGLYKVNSFMLRIHNLQNYSVY